MPSTSRTTFLIPIPIIILSISFLLLLTVSAHSHHGVENHTVHAKHKSHLHPHRHRHQGRLAREFVQAHNLIRQQLNEPPLVWDRKLARYARRWATQRMYDCKMTHSYGPYGENIFWGGRDHWTAAEAVESWVRENEFYDPDTNQCVQGEMCGHYTQVVWKSSVRVGCTRMKCATGGVLVFCEYDPPGNYVNENPFGKVFEENNNVFESQTTPPETPSITSSMPLETTYQNNDV